jgi:hypothetical protein
VERVEAARRRGIEARESAEALVAEVVGEEARRRVRAELAAAAAAAAERAMQAEVAASRQRAATRLQAAYRGHVVRAAAGRTAAEAAYEAAEAARAGELEAMARQLRLDQSDFVDEALEAAAQEGGAVRAAATSGRHGERVEDAAAAAAVAGGGRGAGGEDWVPARVRRWRREEAALRHAARGQLDEARAFAAELGPEALAAVEALEAERLERALHPQRHRQLGQQPLLAQGAAAAVGGPLPREPITADGSVLRALFEETQRREGSARWEATAFGSSSRIPAEVQQQLRARSIASLVLPASSVRPNPAGGGARGTDTAGGGGGGGLTPPPPPPPTLHASDARTIASFVEHGRARAGRQEGQATLTCVDLSGNYGLGADGAVQLALALPHSALEALNLSGCAICGLGGCL